MPDVSQIVQAAMDKMGTPFPLEKSEREDIIDYETNPDELDFENEDKAFYNLADTNQFFRKLPKFVPFANAYARKHLSLEKE